MVEDTDTNAQNEQPNPRPASRKQNPAPYALSVMNTQVTTLRPYSEMTHSPSVPCRRHVKSTQRFLLHSPYCPGMQAQHSARFDWLKSVPAFRSESLCKLQSFKKPLCPIQCQSKQMPWQRKNRSQACFGVLPTCCSLLSQPPSKDPRTMPILIHTTSLASKVPPSIPPPSQNEAQTRPNQGKSGAYFGMGVV